MRIKAKIVRILGIFVALFAFSAGYALTSGKLPMSATAQARPLTMPANPHVLFLAPAGAQRGLLNSDVALARGATPVQSWRNARTVASHKPLDALLIDASLLDVMTASDRVWLQAQLREGVVLVGLGVDDDQFAQTLGLTTFRTPAEANVPIGPSGYRLVKTLVLGHSDDVQALAGTNWLERAIRGDSSPAPITIQHPMVSSFGTARGELSSEKDVDLLFLGVRSAIENIYEIRAEFQQQQRNGG